MQCDVGLRVRLIGCLRPTGVCGCQRLHVGGFIVAAHGAQGDVSACFAVVGGREVAVCVVAEHTPRIIDTVVLPLCPAATDHALTPERHHDLPAIARVAVAL